MIELIPHKLSVDIQEISAIKLIDSSSCRIYMSGSEIEVPLSYQMMMSLIKSRRNFEVNPVG